VDEPAGGILRVSGWKILTSIFATQADILTSISSTTAYRYGFYLPWNAPLPLVLLQVRSFGVLLSPVHFRRGIA
jgi:hypothetical protein